MAEYYGFFNGIEYDENFVNLVDSKLLKNGVFSDACNVTPAYGMTVNVNTGFGIINGGRYYNDAVKPITLTTAHPSLARIDCIVLRRDYVNRKINAVLVTGTAENTPSVPALIRTNECYDLRLAEIYVKPSTPSITAANITDTRWNESLCGVTTTYLGVDVESLTAQAEAEFEEWFDTIKGKLTEDVAGGLQAEIDAQQETINTHTTQLNAAALTSGDLLKWDGAKLVKANPGADYATFNLIYPVGAIYTSVNNVNPSTLFGGTWVSFAAGRTLVGVDTAQTEFNTVKKTGGEKAVDLTAPQIPPHIHNASIAKFTSVTIREGSGTPWTDIWGGALTPNPTSSSGSGEPHNNLQPYITVYFWQRTA